MKQLKFNKKDPNMGDVSGILRIDGKILYFKFNQSEQAQAIITSTKARGAIVTEGRKWIRINIFAENKEVILNKEQFNVDDKTDNEVEDILLRFYSEKYTQAGFECEISELNKNDTEN